MQRVANLGQCVRRDGAIACDCMEDRKQLFANRADAPQRRSPHRRAGLDFSPIRQLSLASPQAHLPSTLEVILRFRRIRSKGDGVDEIERKISGDKLISIVPAVHGGGQPNPMVLFYTVMLV